MKYFKSGMRDYYRIDDGELVTHVVNKEKLSKVELCQNGYIAADAEDGKECTQEEFDTQLKTALTRIKGGKL